MFFVESINISSVCIGDTKTWTTRWYSNEDFFRLKDTQKIRGVTTSNTGEVFIEVYDIASYTLSYITSLRLLNMDSSNGRGYLYFEDFCAVLVFYDGDSTHIERLEDVPNLKTVYVSKGVTYLPDYFCMRCNFLENVTLPEGLLKLGKGCFSQCTNIHKILIPSSLRSLSAFCFMYCSFLEEVEIAYGVEDIKEECFCFCTHLVKVSLPNSLINLGHRAFCACPYITTVHIPEGVEKIGSECFSNCVRLKEINIPDSVKTIGDNCFVLCDDLAEISIPNGLILGDNVFPEHTKITIRR